MYSVLSMQRCLRLLSKLAMLVLVLLEFAVLHFLLL